VTKNQKIEAVKTAMVRNASVNGVCILTDLEGDELKLLWHGATFRGLLQFIRLNEEVWGGRYVPSRKILGDPRAFNGEHRQTRWTHPKYILKWGKDNG
jgi:hypothetical protein